MQATPDSLTELKDIHLPQAIGWWPLAWGWWLLLTCLLLLLIVTIVWWQRNRYRFLAKKILNQHYVAYQQSLDSQAYVRNLAELLKRVAVTAYGYETVSILQGEAWLIFLNTKTKAPLFNNSIKNYLIEAPFCDKHYFSTQFADIDTQELHQLAIRWLRQHR